MGSVRDRWLGALCFIMVKNEYIFTEEFNKNQGRLIREDERQKKEEKTEKEFLSCCDVQEKELEKESKNKNVFKKFLKGLGLGGLYIGGGVFFVLFSILQFLVPAVAGLLMVWWAIAEFLKGSIIVGLLVLLIGTPVAIGIAHWAFIFLFFLAIFSAIVWGVANLFGLSISFGNAWDIIWLVIKTLFLGGMAFLGISGFIGAIKKKKVIEFFRGNWFYVLFFFFLFWLFFL